MTIDALVSSLDGAKQTGSGKYIARCPAHDDKSPSLAIKDCSDGRVLIHCFAGCETEDVLSAVGLAFSDLMPERISGKHGYKPQTFDARQVLVTLDHESLVVALIGADLIQHKKLDGPTWERLARSVNRINSARATVAPS